MLRQILFDAEFSRDSGSLHYGFDNDTHKFLTLLNVRYQDVPSSGGHHQHVTVFVVRAEPEEERLLLVA